MYVALIDNSLLLDDVVIGMKKWKNILDYDSSGVESQDGVVYSSYNNADAVVVSIHNKNWEKRRKIPAANYKRMVLFISYPMKSTNHY